jgi:hypothetical protein
MVRELALGLVRERYADFGRTLPPQPTKHLSRRRAKTVGQPVFSLIQELP